MPTWEGRLSPLDRKILALYVARSREASAMNAPSPHGSDQRVAGSWPAGLLLLVGANAHLVYVAMTSQPDCVAHVKAGEAGSGQFQRRQVGLFAGERRPMEHVDSETPPSCRRCRATAAATPLRALGRRARLAGRRMARPLDPARRQACSTACASSLVSASSSAACSPSGWDYILFPGASPASWSSARCSPSASTRRAGGIEAGEPVSLPRMIFVQAGVRRADPVHRRAAAAC